jgi:hypothetical protein
MPDFLCGRSLGPFGTHSGSQCQINNIDGLSRFRVSNLRSDERSAVVETDGRSLVLSPIASGRPTRLICSTTTSCMNFAARSWTGIWSLRERAGASGLTGAVGPAGRAGRSCRFSARCAKVVPLRELAYDRIRPRRSSLPSLLSGQGATGLDQGGGQEGRRLSVVRQARLPHRSRKTFRSLPRGRQPLCPGRGRPRMRTSAASG